VGDPQRAEHLPDPALADPDQTGHIGEGEPLAALGDAGAGRETFDDACGRRHGGHILDGRRRLGHPDDLAHTAIVADRLPPLEQVVGEDYLIPGLNPCLPKSRLRSSVLCQQPHHLHR